MSGVPFDCPVCGHKRSLPMTNADRIRAMTDEELAEFILRTTNCDEYACEECPFCGPVRKMLDWLQQPCGGAE